VNLRPSDRRKLTDSSRGAVARTRWNHSVFSEPGGGFRLCATKPVRRIYARRSNSEHARTAAERQTIETPRWHRVAFGLTHHAIGTILDIGMNTMLAFFY
jgi:hypothetical protein